MYPVGSHFYVCVLKKKRGTCDIYAVTIYAIYLRHSFCVCMGCFDNEYIYLQDELKMIAKTTKQKLKLSSNKAIIITVTIQTNTRKEIFDEKNAQVAPPN